MQLIFTAMLSVPKLTIIIIRKTESSLYSAVGGTSFQEYPLNDSEEYLPIWHNTHPLFFFFFFLVLGHVFKCAVISSSGALLAALLIFLINLFGGFEEKPSLPGRYSPWLVSVICLRKVLPWLGWLPPCHPCIVHLSFLPHWRNKDVIR